MQLKNNSLFSCMNKRFGVTFVCGLEKRHLKRLIIFRPPVRIWYPLQKIINEAVTKLMGS